MLSLDTNNKNVVTLKKDGKVIADIVFKDIKTGKKISVGILIKSVGKITNTQKIKIKYNTSKV
ncbi:hypothetical protein E1H50_09240 [Clostridioides difficile]|nr:hypothetical protein [Clostridioides difficile]